MTDKDTEASPIRVVDYVTLLPRVPPIGEPTPELKARMNELQSWVHAHNEKVRATLTPVVHTNELATEIPGTTTLEAEREKLRALIKDMPKVEDELHFDIEPNPFPKLHLNVFDEKLNGGIRKGELLTIASGPGRSMLYDNPMLHFLKQRAGGAVKINLEGDAPTFIVLDSWSPDENGQRWGRIVRQGKFVKATPSRNKREGRHFSKTGGRYTRHHSEFDSKQEK